MSKKFRAVYDPGDAVITGRFPVVAADIANGAVIDTKLATDAVTPTKIQALAVTTGKIADDAVTQPKAATGVVDGDTITGAVFQTSVPGVGHPTIMLDGPNNALKFFIGSSGETPGDMTPGNATPLIRIQSGTVGALTTQPELRLTSGSAGSSAAKLEGDQLTLSGPSGSAAAQVNLIGFGTGAGMDTWQVVCSADIPKIDTTNSTITGLSQTVTCPGTAAVYLVTIDADWQMTVVNTTAIIELLVGGVAQTAQMILVAGLGRWAQSKTWRITGLASGSRTFTAQTRNTASSTGSVVKATNTLMTVERKA